MKALTLGLLVTIGMMSTFMVVLTERDLARAEINSQLCVQLPCHD